MTEPSSLSGIRLLLDAGVELFAPLLDPFVISCGGISGNRGILGPATAEPIRLTPKRVGFRRTRGGAKAAKRPNRKTMSQRVRRRHRRAA